MNMKSAINAHRKGDENIGKLIVFAVTIIIAIGLVALVSYFFNENREKTALTSVVFSTTSDYEDLTAVIPDLPAALDDGEASYDVSYDALSGQYTATLTDDDAATTDESIDMSDPYVEAVSKVATIVEAPTVVADNDVAGTSVIVFEVK